MTNETEIANLKAEIAAIQTRNKRVEADKEMVSNPFRNALIPTVGFYLSTLSLPIIKKQWMKRHSDEIKINE